MHDEPGAHEPVAQGLHPASACPDATALVIAMADPSTNAFLENVFIELPFC